MISMVVTVCTQKHDWTSTKLTNQFKKYARSSQLWIKECKWSEKITFKKATYLK